MVLEVVVAVWLAVLRYIFCSLFVEVLLLPFSMRAPLFPFVLLSVTFVFLSQIYALPLLLALPLLMVCRRKSLLRG